MKLRATIRRYGIEPGAAVLATSLLLNCFGPAKLSDFMHDEARDILSMGEVLFGASLALWIGLFWIANSDFGRWLARQEALREIDTAYVVAALTFFITDLGAMICAHVQSTHKYTQLVGFSVALCGLANVPTLLGNTRGLLALYSAFTKRSESVTSIRQAVER